MTAEFRRGWRAACEALAQNLRNDARFFCRPDPQPGELLRDLADEIEATPPPKTMTVVDGDGRRLL